MEKDSFEKWNEQMAEKYDIEDYYTNSNRIVRYIEIKRINWILKLVSSEDNENVLEIGCGAGHVLQGVAAGNLYGIDLSLKMLSLARRRLGDRVELRKCDAENIEYPDNFFDKIICSEVLEHTPNPSRVIQETARVAKPGGAVILTIPNEDLIQRFKDVLIAARVFRFLLKNIPEKNEWHLHSFSLPILRSMIRGILEEVEVIAVPSKLLPIRYVGKYKVLK